jgi:hypothetical protein
MYNSTKAIYYYNLVAGSQMLKQDEPLLVDQDGVLLDVHHRYKIPKELANLKRRELNNQIGIKVNQRNC